MDSAPESVEPESNLESGPETDAESQDELEPRANPERPSCLRKGLILVAVLLGVCGVLASVSVAGYRIPTASMAPTFLGDHFEVACRECGWVYQVGKREQELRSGSPSVAVRSMCPLCQRAQENLVGLGDVRPGAGVAINRVVYLGREPRRFEVVAYRKPGGEGRTYLQRLVGLPGDTLRIENGDLYRVVDGVAEHLRPSDSEQDELWYLLHDSSIQPRGLRVPSYAPESPEKGTWTITPADDGHPSPRLSCRPSGADRDWIRYQGELDTRLGYERTEISRRNIPTADLRVRAEIKGEAGAEVSLAIRETFSGASGRAARLVTARFLLGQGRGDCSVWLDGEEQVSQEVDRLDPARSHELTLAYANDRLRVLADGRLLVTWEDADAPKETLRGEVLLGVGQAPATIQRLRIDRDLLHYVPGYGYSETDPSAVDVKLPPGGYFFLGDNSANALDSRSFGTVPRENLIGPVEHSWR